MSEEKEGFADFDVYAEGDPKYEEIIQDAKRRMEEAENAEDEEDDDA